MECIFKCNNNPPLGILCACLGQMVWLYFQRTFLIGKVPMDESWSKMKILFSPILPELKVLTREPSRAQNNKLLEKCQSKSDNRNKKNPKQLRISLLRKSKIFWNTITAKQNFQVPQVCVEGWCNICNSMTTSTGKRIKFYYILCYSFLFVCF